MTRSRVVDLTPATNAFLSDMMDNLERAEKSGGTYSSQRSFIWRRSATQSPLALTAFAIAKPTDWVGEFELHLTFGSEGDSFRTAHQDQLIKEMEVALKAGGWEIIPADNDRPAATSSDGIFFNVMRPEAQVSPAE